MADQIYHVLQTFFGLLPLIIVSVVSSDLWAFALAGAVSGLWFSWWREDAQHRKMQGWSWPLHGSGGRWVDMFFGTLGGLLAGILLALLS